LRCWDGVVVDSIIVRVAAYNVESLVHVYDVLALH
jgi:hypothetical protein